MVSFSFFDERTNEITFCCDSSSFYKSVWMSELENVCVAFAHLYFYYK